MTFAKKCGSAIGDSIALSITGPGAFNYGAAVNDQGRGEFLVSLPEKPTVSIEMSTHDWFLLTCGRDGRDQVAPLIHGDQDLGRRVLENFVITP